MCEKSCQKSVTIRVTSRSTLLSFCQIFVTITKKYLAIPEMKMQHHLSKFSKSSV
jgi:hypothetical protein